MPFDALGVGLRLGLYTSLMVLSGVPAFCLYAMRYHHRVDRLGPAFSPLLRVALGLGCLLSVGQLAFTVKAMSGAETYGDIDVSTLGMVLGATAFGTSWIVRMMALALCASGLVGMARGHWRAMMLTSASAFVALCTLAWGGHGAMDDAARGAIHLMADLAHLVAAGIWVGAITCFLLQCLRSRPLRDLDVLADTSRGFATVGAVTVVVLVASGLLNYFFVANMDLAVLTSTPYGWLLLVKLGLFGLMLLLAAINRNRIAPVLERQHDFRSRPGAANAFMRSLVLEAALATGVLAAVAWLGMLAPSA